jgi:hypothetical protein
MSGRVIAVVQKAKSGDIIDAGCGARETTASYWERLATEAGVRLPQGRTKLTTGAMEWWLRRLKIPAKDFSAWSGLSLGKWLEYNPSWTYRQFAGLVLEHREQMGVW